VPKRRCKSKGFTLIELLVVIAIIGILAAAIIVRTIGVQRAGRDTRRKQDLAQLRAPLADYQRKHQGNYPSSLSALVPDYASQVPSDPLTGASYTYGVDDATNPTDYVIMATLEDSGDPELGSDVDGTVYGVNCDDPNYCIRP